MSTDCLMPVPALAALNDVSLMPAPALAALNDVCLMPALALTALNDVVCLFDASPCTDSSELCFLFV